MNHLIRTTVAAAGLFVVLPTGSSEASTALACGAVVATDVRLRNDLVDCPEYGLVVAADGITIDLAGHRIDGAGRDTTRSGVFVDGYDGVIVRNGSITEFAVGVDAYQSGSSRFAELDVRRTTIGVDINESDGMTIAGVTARSNGTGVSIIASPTARVTRSDLSANETTGLTARDGANARIAANTFTAIRFDGMALERAAGATVERNVFRRNGLGGLYWIASDGGTVAHNLAIDNDTDGLHADGDNTSFRGNAAFGNGAAGIRASTTAVDAGRNVARRNGEADCIGVTCR